MRKQFHPNTELYRHHFNSQYGGNILPGFRGVANQRGYGLGSMFSSLFRSFVPLLKSGAKTVGRKAFNTGIRVAQDVLAGKNLRSAAIERSKEAGRELKSQALNAAKSLVTPQSGKGVKRKSAAAARNTKRTKTGKAIKRRSTSKQVSHPSARPAKRSKTSSQEVVGFPLLKKKGKK